MQWGRWRGLADVSFHPLLSFGFVRSCLVLATRDSSSLWTCLGVHSLVNTIGDLSSYCWGIIIGSPCCFSISLFRPNFHPISRNCFLSISLVPWGLDTKTSLTRRAVHLVSWCIRSMVFTQKLTMLHHSLHLGIARSNRLSGYVLQLVTCAIEWVLRMTGERQERVPHAW